MRAILSQGTRTELASCLPGVLLLSLSFIGISKFSLFANSLKWPWHYGHYGAMVSGYSSIMVPRYYGSMVPGHSIIDSGAG